MREWRVSATGEFRGLGGKRFGSRAVGPAPWLGDVRRMRRVCASTEILRERPERLRMMTVYRGYWCTSTEYLIPVYVVCTHARCCIGWEVTAEIVLLVRSLLLPGAAFCHSPKRYN